MEAYRWASATTTTTRRPLSRLAIGTALVIAALLMASLWPGPAASQPPPTLQDFGYQSLRVNGDLPMGPRPLLLIYADFAGSPAFDHSVAFYDSLVFRTFDYPTVSGYFLENSNGRFYFVRAGVGVVRVTFTDAERTAFRMDVGSDLGQIVAKAYTSGGFNFAGYDNDGDGSVTENELSIAIVSNNYGTTNVAGATRNIGAVQPAGLAVQVRGDVCSVGMYAGLTTWCHEITHVLDPYTIDLYGTCTWCNCGCLNSDVTLMDATIGPADDRITYHLDPWHKMALGWCEPRILSMRTSTATFIAAAQLADTQAPIILYDPTHGWSEFYMLEYRTRSSPEGPGYDANVSGFSTPSGLAIWNVQLDAFRHVFAVPTEGGMSILHAGAPNLAKGTSNQLWAGGVATPPLAWYDGTLAPTQITIDPFTSGAGSIGVTWLGSTWVDFAFPLLIELGTFDFPFNSISEGVNATPSGGLIRIKPGEGIEPITIVKSLTLKAWGGTATLR